MSADVQLESVSEMALRLAGASVDEEIAHHPELLSMRQTLLTSKAKQFEKEIQERNNQLIGELTRASTLIKEHFISMPAPERDAFLEKFPKVEDEAFILPEELMQAIYALGVDLQNQEKHADAIAIFKFLILQNSNISDFWMALGLSQLCLGTYPEALRSFKLSIEADPTNPRGYYYTAYAYHLLGEDTLSLQEVEAGLELKDSPTFAEWEPTLKEIQLVLKQGGGEQ